MKIKKLFAVLTFSLTLCTAAMAQTTEFTYQGRLADGAVAATGNYDFQFGLYDVLSSGTVLSTQTVANVSVSSGAFTVKLDFGAAFPGDGRWLEIRLKPAGSAAPYTVLTPRQPVTSAPYSIKAVKSQTAVTADNATQLGGVAASQYVQSTDSRLTDARNPLAGSTAYIQNNGGGTAQSASLNISGTATVGNLFVNGLMSGNLPGGDASYIQNRTTPQTGTSNFNISGTGTADIFDASTVNANTVNGTVVISSIVNANNSYRMNGSRMLSAPGTNNTFVGIQAGSANTGADNTFSGFNAGNNNTSGHDNSFYGSDAGGANTTGINNSFFGSDAGDSNTSGGSNSFFGSAAGSGNTSGILNSFFGARSGEATTTGDNNSFFGALAGIVNTGSDNSFFGKSSGGANTVGIQNSFFGANAGKDNTASYNSFFGYDAGANTSSGNQNSFFGRSAGAINSTGADNAFFGYNAGDSNSSGINNSFFGSLAGNSTTNGDDNTFIGRNAGDDNTTGNKNIFIGSGAGDRSVSDSGNIAIGTGTQLAPGSYNNVIIGTDAAIDPPIGELTFCYHCTAIGAGAKVYGNAFRAAAIGSGAYSNVDNQIAIGSEYATVIIRGSLVVDGTITENLAGRNGASEKLAKQNALIEAQQKQLDDLKLLVNSLKKALCAQTPSAGVCSEVQK